MKRKRDFIKLNKQSKLLNYYKIFTLKNIIFLDYT